MANQVDRQRNWIKAGLLAVGLLCFSIGMIGYFNEGLFTSSSVGGKELPIYCVETNKKQVALSFDAAWGNEDTKKILEILKKHDVHVTFFMTGGWVDRWAYLKDILSLTNIFLTGGQVVGQRLVMNLTRQYKSECLYSFLREAYKCMSLFP